MEHMQSQRVRFSTVVVLVLLVCATGCAAPYKTTQFHVPKAGEEKRKLHCYVREPVACEYPEQISVGSNQYRQARLPEGLRPERRSVPPLSPPEPLPLFQD